ncbi:MAG: hypothetical protein M3303_10635 [Gemmatimonadota bacterium]|nr:hypothetical protein [Gemmatimonadota bacterium]
MVRLLRPLVGVLALATLATTASAQSANINATATVLQPLTVSGARDLAFGNVYPGVNKSIAVADATSGRFDLTGVASAQVQFSFTLPTNLNNGGNTLPIGTWTGYHNTTNSASVGGTAFTPSSSNTTTNLAAVTGQLFIFVGATVSPSGTQTAGPYTAQVTATAAYTGL